MPTRIESNISRSAELTDVEDVHVVIVLVLARHDPDERVGAGSHPHVDRPGRRNHRLAVRHDDVAGGVALTHEVHHPALLGIVEIEIEIYLAPAFMDVRRSEEHTSETQSPTRTSYAVLP